MPPKHHTEPNRADRKAEHVREHHRKIANASRIMTRCTLPRINEGGIIRGLGTIAGATATRNHTTVTLTFPDGATHHCELSAHRLSTHGLPGATRAADIYIASFNTLAHAYRTL